MHKLVVELEKQYLATQQVSQIYGRASKYIQSKNKAQKKANSLMEKRGKDYERQGIFTFTISTYPMEY